MAKLGWYLANGVGIIDNKFAGEVMIMLKKFGANAAELKLPARVAQIIFKVSSDFEYIKVTYMPVTERGENGFGSSVFTKDIKDKVKQTFQALMPND